MIHRRLQFAPSARSAADSLAVDVVRKFRERFGADPELLAIAPGRVNLIGEHTDYNGGFVLPMAIERHTAIAARRRGVADSALEPRGKGSHRKQASAKAASRAIVHSASIDQQDEFEVDQAQSLHAGPHWSSYVRGVVAGALRRGWRLPAFEALVDTTIPVGGGLSSSAALEVATLLLVERLAGERLPDVEQALLCQRAEHEFAGAPCGVMDQFACLHGRADSLLLLDCRTLEARPTPLDDPDVVILIADSRVKHRLADGGNPYAQRRAECEAASAALGVGMLRDARLADLEPARTRLDPVVFRRARHVITEIARTESAAAAARERNWASVGLAMYESHESLRSDFEVSCPELDALVDLAREIGEAGGVYGARMTGGGFGGCTVNLVRAAAAERIAARLIEGYRQATGREAEVFATRAAPGAELLEVANYISR